MQFDGAAPGAAAAAILLTCLLELRQTGSFLLLSLKPEQLLLAEMA
jgi:hypothetical protein